MISLKKSLKGLPCFCDCGSNNLELILSDSNCEDPNYPIELFLHCKDCGGYKTLLCIKDQESLDLLFSLAKEESKKREG